MRLRNFLTKHDMHARQFSAGEIIYQPGDPTDHAVMLVLDGLVETTPAPDDLYLQTRYERGAFFGVTGMLSEARTETARAICNHTKVLFVTAESFDNYLKSDHVLLAELVEIGIESLHQFPEAAVAAPAQPIDIAAVLGDSAGERFDAIRRKNLEISRKLSNTQEVCIAPGQYLFHADEPGDIHIYLLTTGNIEQTIHSGGEERPVISIEAGSLFGFLRRTIRCGRILKTTHLLSAKGGPEGARLIPLDKQLLGRIARLDVSLAHAVFMNVILTIGIVHATMTALRGRNPEDAPSA